MNSYIFKCILSVHIFLGSLYIYKRKHTINPWLGLIMLPLHLGLAVWRFLILIFVLLRYLLIRFLHFILLQHWAPQLHISALKLIFGQELYDSSSYRISQDVSCCAKSITGSAKEKWIKEEMKNLYWDSKYQRYLFSCQKVSYFHLSFHPSLKRGSFSRNLWGSIWND